MSPPVRHRHRSAPSRRGQAIEMIVGGAHEQIAGEKNLLWLAAQRSLPEHLTGQKVQGRNAAAAEGHVQTIAGDGRPDADAAVEDPPPDDPARSGMHGEQRAGLERDDQPPPHSTTAARKQATRARLTTGRRPTRRRGPADPREWPRGRARRPRRGGLTTVWSTCHSADPSTRLKAATRPSKSAAKSRSPDATGALRRGRGQGWRSIARATGNNVEGVCGDIGHGRPGLAGRGRRARQQGKRRGRPPRRI